MYIDKLYSYTSTDNTINTDVIINDNITDTSNVGTHTSLTDNVIEESKEVYKIMYMLKFLSIKIIFQKVQQTVHSSIITVNLYPTNEQSDDIVDNANSTVNVLACLLEICELSIYNEILYKD